MKLYYIPDAPLGHRWQGTQADAKTAAKTFASGFTQREVPVDKPNLLQWLNAEEQVTLQQATAEHPLDPLEQAELKAVAAARQTTMPPRYADYETPYNARTTLAEIDAGLSAKAIRQFDGPELAKVAAAVIERMSQLSFSLRAAGGEVSNGS